MWSPSHGWLAWNGRNWEYAPEAAKRAVHDCVRGITEEARQISGTDLDIVGNYAPGHKSMRLSEAMSHWGMKSEMIGRLELLGRDAESELKVSVGDLDAHPLAINVHHGTLWINESQASIECRSHSSLDRITKIAECSIEQRQMCPRYDEFLEQAQPDERVRRVLHQWAGLCLLGKLGPRICVHWGEARNTKEAFVKLHSRMAGTYSDIVSSSELSKIISLKATPSLKRHLQGVRHVRSSGSLSAAAIQKIMKQAEQARRVGSPGRSDSSAGFGIKLSVCVDEARSGEGLASPYQDVVQVDWREDTATHFSESWLREEGGGVFRHALEGLEDYLRNGAVPLGPEQDAPPSAKVAKRSQRPKKRVLRPRRAPQSLGT